MHGTFLCGRCQAIDPSAGKGDILCVPSPTLLPWYPGTFRPPHALHSSWQNVCVAPGTRCVIPRTRLLRQHRSHPVIPYPPHAPSPHPSFRISPNALKCTPKPRRFSRFRREVVVACSVPWTAEARSTPAPPAARTATSAARSATCLRGINPRIRESASTNNTKTRLF